MLHRLHVRFCLTISAALVVSGANVPVVNVFARNESAGAGVYFCIKIPSLTALPDGTLLALGEGRVGNCSDFAETHLVMKKSKDGGKTWSALSIAAKHGMGKTIGNAAPVVISETEIVLVYCENNKKVFVEISDDLGETWSKPTDITQNATLPHWKWVGTGPPAGLRLRSGRIIIPSYHDALLPGHYDDGELSKGHAMLSDDNGRTWRLSADSDFGGDHWPNEVQAVELSDGHVAFFSRSLLTHRLRTESPDGGEHWGASEVLNLLETTSEGCEGSTIACRSNPDHLVYSGPISPGLYREKMSIMQSTDKGHTWSFHKLIDNGSSAYSSLAWHGSTLGVLYERSQDLKLIFEPDYISFSAIEDPCANMTMSTSILV